jgi:hypothetical protein
MSGLRGVQESKTNRKARGEIPQSTQRSQVNSAGGLRDVRKLRFPLEQVYAG